MRTWCSAIPHRRFRAQPIMVVPGVENSLLGLLLWLPFGLLPVLIKRIPATLTAGNCKAALFVDPEQLKRSGVLLRV